jgi:hypothetical protein
MLLECPLSFEHLPATPFAAAEVLGRLRPTSALKETNESFDVIQLLSHASFSRSHASTCSMSCPHGPGKTSSGMQHARSSRGASSCGPTRCRYSFPYSCPLQFFPARVSASQIKQEPQEKEESAGRVLTKSGAKSAQRDVLSVVCLFVRADSLISNVDLVFLQGFLAPEVDPCLSPSFSLGVCSVLLNLLRR